MNDNREILLKYLKSQNLMSLATHSSGLAVCTVYYAIDDKFNFYFVSPEDTEHSQNIKVSENVACSIADSHQPNSVDKIGVQIKGEAEKITNLETMKAALLLWNKTNPGAQDVVNFKNIKNKIINTRVYKITPVTIKFFNQELYGDDEFEIFNFSINKLG